MFEGIKAHISFGHYETEAEYTFLVADLTKNIELTATRPLNEIMDFKEEFLKQCSDAFDVLVEDHNRMEKYEKDSERHFGTLPERRGKKSDV